VTVGFWFAARSSTSVAYPCRCHERPRDCGKDEPWGCPCWGRQDLLAVPAQCCARRNGKAIAAIHARAQRLLDASLGRAVASGA
jgi:hypothetical protein